MNHLSHQRAPRKCSAGLFGALIDPNLRVINPWGGPAVELLVFQVRRRLALGGLAGLRVDPVGDADLAFELGQRFL